MNPSKSTLKIRLLPNVQGNHIIQILFRWSAPILPSGAEEYKHNINRVILDLTGPDIENHYEGPFLKPVGIYSSDQNQNIY